MDQEPCEEPSPASDMSSAAHAALDDGRLPHIATPKDVTGTVSPTASTIASSPVVARDAKEVHEEPPCKKQRLDAEEVTVDSLLSMSNPLTRPLPSEQNVAMPTTGTIPPPPLDNTLQTIAQPITRTMPIPSTAGISPTPHSPVAIVDKPPQSASQSPMLQPHSVVSTDLTEHDTASTSSYSSSEFPCDTSTNEVVSVVVAPLPSIFDTCDVLPSATPSVPSFASKDTDSRTLSAPSILDPACHPTSPPSPPTTTVDKELPALGAIIDVSPSSQAPCVGADTSLTVPTGATVFVSLAPGPPASDPSATSMQHDTLDGGASGDRGPQSLPTAPLRHNPHQIAERADAPDDVIPLPSTTATPLDVVATTATDSDVIAPESDVIAPENDVTAPESDVAVPESDVAGSSKQLSMDRPRINPMDTLPQGVLVVAHSSHLEQPALGSKFPSVSSPTALPLSTPPPHPDAAARCPHLQAGAPPSTHLPETWLQRVKKEVPGADNATARPRGTNPVWILDESCPSTPSTSAGRRAKRRKRKRRQEPEHSSHPQTGGLPPPTATNDESPAKKKPQPSSGMVVVMKGLHAINDVTATKPCDRAHDSSSSSQSSTVARSPLVKTEQSVVNVPPPPISHLVTDKANNGLTDGLAQAATTSTSNVANERQQVSPPHQSSTSHAKKKKKRPPVSKSSSTPPPPPRRRRHRNPPVEIVIDSDDDALDPRLALHISSSSSSSDNDAVVVMVTKQPKSGSSPELTPGARRRRRRRLLASKDVTVDLTEPDTKKAAVVRLDESDQSDASGNVVALNSLAELLPSMATPITDAVADDKAVEQGEVEGVGEGASVAGPPVDDTSSLILQQLAEQDDDDDIASTLDLALLGTITDKDDSTDGGGPAGEDTLPATLQIESQTAPTLLVQAAASVPTESPPKHPVTTTTTTPLREQGPTDDEDAAAAAIGGMDGSVESSSTGGSKGGVKSTNSDQALAVSSAQDAAVPRDQPLESDLHGVGGLPLTPELVPSVPLPDESSDQRRATDNMLKEELGAQPSSSSNDYDAALVEMCGEDGAAGSLSGADEPALSSPIKDTQSAVHGDSSAPFVASAHVEPSRDVVADVDTSCEPTSSSVGPPETAAAAPTTTEVTPLVAPSQGGRSIVSDGQADDRYPPTNTTQGNNSPRNNPPTDEVVPPSDLVPLVTAPESSCHPLEPPVTLRLDEAAGNAEGGTAADRRPRRRKRINPPTTLPTSSTELEVDADLSSDGYVSEDDMGNSGKSDDDDSDDSPSFPSNHDKGGGGMLVTPPLAGESTPFVPGPQKEVPSFAAVYAAPTPSADSVHNQPADEDPPPSTYPRPPFPCKEALIAAAFDESDTNHREEEEESDDDKAPPPPPPSNPPRRLPVEGHPPPPLPPDSPLRLQAKQLPPHIYNAKTPLLDNMFSSSSSSSSSSGSSSDEEEDAVPARTPHDHPFRYAKPTPQQLLLPSEDEEEVEFGGAHDGSSSSDDDVVLVGVIPAPSSASSAPRTPVLPPPAESLHPVLRGTYNVAAHEATWTGTWGFTETLPSAPTKFAYKCVAPHWASHDVRAPLTGAYTGYFFVMGEGGHSRPQKVLEKGVHLEFTELAPGSYVVDGVGRNKFGPFSLRGYFEWGHPLTLVKMYTPAA